MRLLYEPAILFLGIYLRQMETCLQKIYIPMSIEALFTIAKAGNSPYVQLLANG